MTREEAIADIRDNIKPVVGGKSLDMAIEALEKINKIDKIAHIRSVEDLNGLNCEEAILGLFKTVLEENKMRNATPEEQKLIDDYIKSISKPTGVDFKTLEQEPCDDMGEISDGYHTFNQLYYQRAVLFATIVNQNKDRSWKSFKHSDGNYCFDSNGEWFIVGIDTPQGSYTYHYAKEYWDMFECEELECGKEWDGHTEEDVTRLLSLEREYCEDKYIKVPKKALKYRTAGMVAYNAEWLKNHFDIERAVICGAQEPCTDAISRQAVLDILDDMVKDYINENDFDKAQGIAWVKVQKLPSVSLKEPCEMTAEEYRRRMIQAFHNTDCDELIAICVLPTEKEFEHLEWLLEKHYKAKPEPCDDVCEWFEQYVDIATDIVELRFSDGTVKRAKRGLYMRDIEKSIRKMLIDQIANEKKQEPKWIPVSERLPEDGTWNIWQSKTGEFSVERYKADAIDHFFPPGRFFQFEEAIAWMPLPEPYKASPTGAESEG